MEANEVLLAAEFVEAESSLALACCLNRLEYKFSTSARFCWIHPRDTFQEAYDKRVESTEASW